MGYIKLSELPLPVVRYTQLPHAKGLPLPTYKSNWAAGLDLYAAIPDNEEIYLINPGERLMVPTGLRMAIPRGYEGQVRPRSGLAKEKGITVLNTPGTIDSDYRGEIRVLLINHGNVTYWLARGERIAQLVIAPVQTVTLQQAVELDNTERGEGGFGSTGTK
jgi:dUTP pyrophosphatase